MNWISVKERLPETITIVKARNRYGKEILANFVRCKDNEYAFFPIKGSPYFTATEWRPLNNEESKTVETIS